MNTQEKTKVNETIADIIGYNPRITWVVVDDPETTILFESYYKATAQEWLRCQRLKDSEQFATCQVIQRISYPNFNENWTDVGHVLHWLQAGLYGFELAAGHNGRSFMHIRHPDTAQEWGSMGQSGPEAVCAAVLKLVESQRGGI